MIEKLPIAELTQLGVGGLFAVVLIWMILNMVLKFLGERKGITERIFEKIENQNLQTAFAVQAIAKAVDNQTRLLEKLGDQQNVLHTEIKEISYASSTNRRNS